MAFRIRTALGNLASAWKTNFRRDKRGGTTIVFALSLFAVMACIGAAVDFSRLDTAKRQLQDASDAAVLRALGLTAASEGARLTAANRAFDQNFSFDGVHSIETGLNTSIDGGRTLETYVVSAKLNSLFGGLIGMDQFDVRVTSQGQAEDSRAEVALVLDSTGSMADANKMTYLKSSVDKVLADIQARGDGRTQVAVVPFTTQIRLPSALRNPAATFLTTAALYPGQAWEGCVIDRAQPYDVSAEGPTGVFASLYPAAGCSDSGLAEARGLTTDIKGTRAFIKTLKPGGYTNITIGMQWGLEALSPSAPLGGGTAFSTPGTRKYMIVVTDGDNTANRWTHTTSLIDARTAQVCASAKAKGVTVFTVRVMAGNSKLLRACATQPDYFYDLSTAAQLEDALGNVFDTIGRTRLTQ